MAVQVEVNRGGEAPDVLLFVLSILSLLSLIAYRLLETRATGQAARAAQNLLLVLGLLFLATIVGVSGWRMSDRATLNISNQANAERLKYEATAAEIQRELARARNLNIGAPERERALSNAIALLATANDNYRNYTSELQAQCDKLNQAYVGARRCLANNKIDFGEQNQGGYSCAPMK